jgi:hypothetical protein
MIESIHFALMTAGRGVLITAATMITSVVFWHFFSSLRFQAEMGLFDCGLDDGFRDQCPARHSLDDLSFSTTIPGRPRTTDGASGVFLIRYRCVGSDYDCGDYGGRAS